MFGQVTCVRALLVLSLYTVTSSTPVNNKFSRSIPPSDFDTCQDLTTYHQLIESLSTVEAIKLITSPLGCVDCPIEVRNIRLKLITLVSNGIINLDSILVSLKSQKISNKYDLLISVLMTIDEFFNIGGSVREDISDALFYLLRRRYIRVNQFRSTKEKYCGHNGIDLYDGYGLSSVPSGTNYVLGPQFYLQPNRQNYQRQYVSKAPTSGPLEAQYQIVDSVTKPPATNLQKRPISGYSKFCRTNGFSREHDAPNAALSPSSRVIATPKGTFRPVYANQRAPKVAQPIWSKGSTTSPASISDSQIKQPTFFTAKPIGTTQKVGAQKAVNVDNLVNLVPVPKYPVEEQMYDKFKTLLRSPAAQEVVKAKNFTQYDSGTDEKDALVNEISKTSGTEKPQQVLNFYNRYKEPSKANLNYESLLGVIPRPTTLKEQKYYNAVQQLLTGSYVDDLPVNNEFVAEIDSTEKLLKLFRALEQNPAISPDISEAVRHYLPAVDGLKKNIDLKSLAVLLGVPTNEEETVYYNILKTFLESSDVYVLMKNINLSHLTNFQRLMLILRELITNEAYQEYSQAATHYRDILVKKIYNFNYFDLLNLITITEANSDDLNVIRNFFYTVEFENILRKLQFTGQSDVDKLLMILQAIVLASPDASVVKAAKGLIPQAEKLSFYQQMNQIVLLIPVPTNKIEETKYNIVQNFLLSENAYRLLGHMDLTIFPYNKYLLQFVLKTVIESDVDATIKDASEFYIDLTDRLRNIEFITRKEIKKNFKLTEILVDTLDLESLTLTQKDEFKKFFRYISEIKPDALSGFDSWDQAQTRSEFIKLLFQYLLESPGTTSEIKHSISVLNSLVKMNGKGALPP